MRQSLAATLFAALAAAPLTLTLAAAPLALTLTTSEAAAQTKIKIMATPKSRAAKPLPTDSASAAIQSALRTLDAEASGVKALAAALQDGLGPAFGAATDMIRDAKGRLIITGLGKSGHIGRKIAATFASTGTPAFFVHGLIIDGEVGAPNLAEHRGAVEVTLDQAGIETDSFGEIPDRQTTIAHRHERRGTARKQLRGLWVEADRGIVIVERLIEPFGGSQRTGARLKQLHVTRLEADRRAIVIDREGKITGLPVDVAARTIRRNCCCRRRLQCNGAVEIGQGRLDLAIAAVGLGTNQQSIDLKAGSWRGLDDGVASRDQYRRCLAAIGIAGSAKGRTRRSDDGAAGESRGDEKQVRFPAQHSRRHRMHRPTADRRFNLFAFRHRFTSDLQGQ